MASLIANQTQLDTTDRSLISGDREYVLHPHAVFRIACLAFEDLDDITTGQTSALLADISRIEQILEPLVGPACDYLEKLIGLDSLDNDVRRSFIKLRRDLFNRRVKPGGLPSNAQSALGPEGEKLVAAAQEQVAKLKDLQEALPEIYADEISQSWAMVRASSLKSENFLKALAFSAPKCLADLKAAETNPDKYTGKRGRNLDSALFNYLLRASTKVSPLTYFTPVAFGRWCDDARPFEHGLGQCEVLNDVQLSRRVVSQILLPLSKNLKFWGQNHPFELNPTLQKHDELYAFTKVWEKGESSARVWGTHPPLGRVPAKTSIEALVKTYQDSGAAAAFTVSELYEQFGQHEFSQDQGAFVRFFAQALHAGLLLPRLDMYEQEDGLRWITEFVSERLPKLGEQLVELTALLRKYTHASSGERIPAKAEIVKCYSACVELAGANEQKSEKAAIIYEDCYLDMEPYRLPPNALGTGIDDANKLGSIFPLLDFTHMVQSITANLFVQKYGIDGSVRASDCIEELSMEAQIFAQNVSPLSVNEQREAVGKISPASDTLLRLKSEFLAEIADLIQPGENISLGDDLIERYAQAIPSTINARPTSYTIIGQAIGELGHPEGSNTGVVINRIYSGHSMLTSRFLSQLPDDEISEIGRYIREISEERTPTELPGVFGFNANLHPRLVDTEISLPGFRHNYSETRKLSLDDIQVSYDNDLDRLVLTHDTEGPLAAHFFGFLVSMMLPRTHQLLIRTNMQGLILDLWQDLDYAGHCDHSELTILSRVSYHGLVLMRRSVFMPHDLLPDPNLPEVEFFRQFHELVSNLGEGLNFFARLVPNQSDIIGGEEGLAAMGETTDFKPSYLSFDMPQTISALQRRLRRRARTVLLQEPLPDLGSAGMSWNGGQHACEIQFEVSRTSKKKVAP